MKLIRILSKKRIKSKEKLKNRKKLKVRVNQQKVKERQVVQEKSLSERDDKDNCEFIVVNSITALLAYKYYKYICFIGSKERGSMYRYNEKLNGFDRVFARRGYGQINNNKCFCLEDITIQENAYPVDALEEEDQFRHSKKRFKELQLVYNPYTNNVLGLSTKYPFTYELCNKDIFVDELMYNLTRAGLFTNKPDKTDEYDLELSRRVFKKVYVYNKRKDIFYITDASNVHYGDYWCYQDVYVDLLFDKYVNKPWRNKFK